jgi:hypothetical protein
MVQPIHQHIFDGVGDLDPTPSSQPPGSRAQPAVRDVSQIPDLSHLTGPTSGVRSPVAGPAATGLSPAAAFAIRSRLDAFRAAATPTYHTPEGDATVSAPFRMQGGYPAHEAAVVQSTEATLRAVAKSLGMSNGDVTMIKAGRATPAQVQRLTQGLIDAGKLPPPCGDLSLRARVRQMMFDHGIGLDCAGYARQAFLAAHPGASGVRWRAPTNEDLSGLAARGLVHLSMSDAQAGDLIVLKPPTAREFGHTLIVYDARPATPADIARLSTIGEMDAVVARIASSPLVHVFVVDASWGCNCKAAEGGVEQRTWFEDRVSGQWVSLEDNRHFSVSNSPYAHPVDGVYRAPGAS